MPGKTLLNTPLISKSVQPVKAKAVAGEPSLHSPSLQATPASSKTVSLNQQSRIVQAHKVAQDAASNHVAETSHTISIMDSSSLPNAPEIHQAVKKLTSLYQDKLQANQEAPTPIYMNICKHTFMLEGIGAALAREKNPDASITYADIMESIQKCSGVDAGVDGNSVRLFSDHALFARGTLDDQLHQAEATFHAYVEILNSPDLTEQEKQYIKLSYDVFKNSVKNLAGEQKAALANTEAGTPEHDAAQKNLKKFSELEKLVFNKEIRQGLRDKVTWKNLMRGVAGTAPALGVGALLHFGYLRNLASDFVTKQPNYNRNHWSQSVGDKAGATGIVGGTANWLITETVVPAVAYVLEKLGGRPVNPVDPTLIYPDAPKFITENGVPRKLGAEEHAQAQQVVENRRVAFKRAQAAFKLGSAAADMVGCAASGAISMTRALYNGEFGINTGTLDARAIGVGVASTIRTGILSYHQLTQTVDGVPTHTIGEPKGVKQIKDGLKRANPLESANRRTWLSKAAGTMEGMALVSMLDTQVAGIDTSTVRGRLTKALGTQAEAIAFLPAFLANSTAGAEVKEAQAQQAISPGAFAGTRTALHGIVHPDSAHIPHASQDPDSLARKAENAYQVIRHAEQLVPQLIVDSMDALATEAQSAASHMPQLVADGMNAMATGARNAASTAYDMGVSTLRRRRRSGAAEPLLS